MGLWDAMSEVAVHVRGGCVGSCFGDGCCGIGD